MAATVGADGSLTLAAEPHDALRAGLPNLKQDATVAHPVEQIQANVRVLRVQRSLVFSAATFPALERLRELPQE